MTIDPVSQKLYNFCQLLPPASEVVTQLFNNSLCFEIAAKVGDKYYFTNAFRALEKEIQNENPNCYLSRGSWSLTNNPQYKRLKETLGLTADEDYGGKSFGNHIQLECVPIQEAGWGRGALILLGLIIATESKFHFLAWTFDAAMDTSKKTDISTEEYRSPLAHNRQMGSIDELNHILYNPNDYTTDYPRRRPPSECDNWRTAALTDVNGALPENPYSLFTQIQNNENSVPYIEKYMPNEVILLPEPVGVYLRSDVDDTRYPITFRQVSLMYAAGFLNEEEIDAARIRLNYTRHTNAKHAIILIETKDCEIIGLAHGMVDIYQFKNGKYYPVLTALKAIHLDPRHVYPSRSQSNDRRFSTIRTPSIQVKNVGFSNHLIRLLTLKYHQYLKAYDPNVSIVSNNRTVLDYIDANLLDSYRRKLGLTKENRNFIHRCSTKDTLVPVGDPLDNVTVCEIEAAIQAMDKLPIP